MNERHHILRTLLFLLTLLPIGIYFFFAWKYSVNIPSWDDYDTLENLLKIQHSESLGETTVHILSQHNEHRIAFNRIVLLWSVWFFGEIDFKILAICGNTALLGLLFILYKNQPGIFKNPLYLAPLPLILFQLQNWHNMTWTLTALSNQFVLLFSGTAFYLLSNRSRVGFVGAFLFSLFATLTQGSGLLAFLACLTVLVLTKRLKESLLWLSGMIAVYSLYFYGYKFSAHNPGLLDALRDPLNFLAYFFSFLGSSISFNSLLFSILLGAGMFSFSLYLVLKNYQSRNPMIFCFMLFIILSALTASLSRSTLGAEQALAYRYKIQSEILTALIYISATELFIFKAGSRLRVSLIIIIAAAGFYFFSAIDGKSKLAFQYEMLKQRLNYWAVYNHGLFFHDQTAANRIMVSSIQGRIYNLPHHILPIPEKFYSQRITDQETCQKVGENNITAGFNGFAVGQDKTPLLFRLEGMVHDLEDVRPDSDSINIVLKSGSDRLLFSTRRQEKPEMSLHFNKNFSNTGFLALIPFKYLKEGPYQVGLCYKSEVSFYNQFIGESGSPVIAGNH